MLAYTPKKMNKVHNLASLAQEASMLIKHEVITLLANVILRGGMARIFIFTIFARLLLPHPIFIQIHLSFIRYFGPFMSIFTKKVFW